MARGKTVPNNIRKLIVERYNDGEKQSAIAKSFKLHRSVVSRVLKKYRNTGDASSAPVPGRPKKTSLRMDRELIRISKKNPYLSSTQILAQLEEYGGANISSSTVRRRLIVAGLSGRRPAKKPLLSKKNIKARLAFAQTHINWTPKDWKKVVFSDESKFNLFSSDGILYVRRPKNQRFNKKYICPTVKHGGGNVLVWGCFSAFGMGPIHRIVGKMDRFMYKDILQTYLVPYLDDTMPLQNIFQHDNDPKHSSKLIKEWLMDENITVMNWPSQSPDLNPIENLWHYVDTKIRHKTYSNLNELYSAIETAWKEVENDYILKLIESMPKRCAEVILQKGHNTKY